VMDLELDCSCGRKVPIKYADAGSQLHCICQTVIDVPQLSVLRVMSGQVDETVTDEPSPQQLKGRRRLRLICILMAVYLSLPFVLWSIFWILKTSNKLTSQLSTARIPSVNFGDIISFILFLILAHFACADHRWARGLLIIQCIGSTIWLVVLAFNENNLYYLIDIVIVLAFLFALFKIKT